MGNQRSKRKRNPALLTHLTTQTKKSYAQHTTPDQKKTHFQSIPRLADTYSKATLMYPSSSIHLSTTSTCQADLFRKKWERELTGLTGRAQSDEQNRGSFLFLSEL